MSEIALATAASTVTARKEVSLAALKQTLESQQAIVRMLQEVTSGSQPLNASGRGSSVNLLA